MISSLKKCCSKSDNAAAYVSEISMYGIAMDVGEYCTYGIVERDGKITKEGYMPTTKEGSCYGSGYVQTTIAWRNTYIWGESREVEFLTLSSFQR